MWHRQYGDREPCAHHPRSPIHSSMRYRVLLLTLMACGPMAPQHAPAGAVELDRTPFAASYDSIVTSVGLTSRWHSGTLRIFAVPGTGFPCQPYAEGCSGLWVPLPHNVRHVYLAEPYAAPGRVFCHEVLHDALDSDDCAPSGRYFSRYFTRC